MAAASANAQAARAERPERASDGGRRVTQSGPLRAAPIAAVGIGGGGGGGDGDGFVVAARCSERRVAVGPRPSLLTFPLPPRTAVSQEPGRWRPGADRLLLLSGRAGARGVPGPRRRSLAPPRAPSALTEGAGPCGPEAWLLGSREGIAILGVGVRGLPSQPTLRERPSTRVYSFICPAVIRWASPLRLAAP